MKRDKRLIIFYSIVDFDFPSNSTHEDINDHRRNDYNDQRGIYEVVPVDLIAVQVQIVIPSRRKAYFRKLEDYVVREDYLIAQNLLFDVVKVQVIVFL